MTEAEKLEIATAFATPQMKRIMSRMRESNQHWRAVAKDTDKLVTWARRDVWKDLS